LTDLTLKRLSKPTEPGTTPTLPTARSDDRIIARTSRRSSSRSCRVRHAPASRLRSAQSNRTEPTPYERRRRISYPPRQRCPWVRASVAARPHVGEARPSAARCGLSNTGEDEQGDLYPSDGRGRNETLRATQPQRARRSAGSARDDETVRLDSAATGSTPSLRPRYGAQERPSSPYDRSMPNASPCSTFDCRCGHTAPCPSCGRVVHVAGRLVSYHPPCPADIGNAPPRSRREPGRCSATTKRGARCPNPTDRACGLCHVHDPDGTFRRQQRRKHKM